MEHYTAPKYFPKLSFDMLGLVRDKWSVSLLNRLSGGPLRFAELRRRAAPISQKVLTQSLRRLERYGMVNRRVEPTTPPQVEYALTPLGRGFLAKVGLICSWTSENLDDLEAAVHRFDEGVAA